MAMKRLLSFLMCVLAAVPAAAQSDRGRIAGTIYDASGATVPHAIVIATSLTTQLERQVEADDKGHYAVDNLLPATYRIMAAASGFAEVTVPDVVLGAGQEGTRQFHLQLQGVTEEVAVSAEAPLVDTSSAHIGASVSTRELDSLPLNGRQVAQLYLLAPGATSTGSGTFNDMR